MFPTIVEAAAMKPTVPTGTPIDRINKGKVGFLAIVELKMANLPIRHNKKTERISVPSF
jgi:hypothetical protein